MPLPTITSATVSVTTAYTPGTYAGFAMAILGVYNQNPVGAPIYVVFQNTGYAQTTTTRSISVTQAEYLANGTYYLNFFIWGTLFGTSVPYDQMLVYGCSMAVTYSDGHVIISNPTTISVIPGTDPGNILLNPDNALLNDGVDYATLQNTTYRDGEAILILGNFFLPTPLPTYPAPASIEYSATDINTVTRSDFNNSEQVYQWGRAYWEWSVQLPFMTEAAAEPWLAAMLSLQGSKNPFQIGDPLRRQPQGNIVQPGYTPVVNGSDQTGFTLAITGCLPSSTLFAGDYLQIGFRLYRCTALTTADGSGNMTVPIWPNIRESPVNGTAIIFSNTKGLFRLKGNPSWKILPNRFYSLVFECVEVINLP